MIGLVRIYIEPRAGLPDHMKPEKYCPFYDVEEQDVLQTRRFWKQKGYDVICIPI